MFLQAGCADEPVEQFLSHPPTLSIAKSATLVSQPL